MSGATWMQGAHELTLLKKVIKKRKRLATKFQKQYPGRKLGWSGGILYLLDDEVPVPGAPTAAKPGREAVGLRWEMPLPHRRGAISSHQHRPWERSSGQRWIW